MEPSTDKEFSDRAVEYIISRKTGELASLTGEKIAETLEMDYSQMVRAFEADQHLGPDQFITREKLHRAVFLMDEDPGISIDDLAQTMGFRGTHEFAEEFENYLLIQPQRYKEIHHPA